MKRLFAILICACLLLALLPTAAAEQTTSGSFELREGFALASVRCVLADGSYTLVPFEETEAGYTYSFPTPDGAFTVLPEYYSLTVWDGAVDLSWYDAAQTEFCLDNPAQLAGLAALVNGRIDADTPDYRVKGDLSELVSTQIDDFLLVGAGGGNQKDTVYRGDPAHDFSGKTVYLCADLDMGGREADGAWSGPNWTPIGGKYPLSRSDSEYVIEAFFNGVLDGNGHRIENLYCDRYADKGYAYSQAVGLVGYLGELYDSETAPALIPAVRNLSVSGSIYGRRMVGGIVGRVGSIPTGVRIENCANFATVRNTDSKGIGGVCGAGWGKGAIVNCYNTGSVSTTYACPAGGICGSNGGLDIYNCYNTGRIDSNGNGRGRAIGGHNGGSYTVSDCYYLEGCDDDPASNGWYVGTALNVSVSCASRTEAEMQSETFVQELNSNGEAYLAVEDGYPVLLWEAEKAGTPYEIKIVQPDGGTIAADRSGTALAGTVLTLSNAPAAGYAFRCYTLNGAALSGPYATVGAPMVLSGVFEAMEAGKLVLPANPACAVSVTKTGTVMQDGEAVAVTDLPVLDGDPLYENDVLTVRATLYDGAVPDDLNYVYSGLFRYRFAFSDGVTPEKATDTGVFTVSSAITGAALTVTVEPYTTHKVWTQLAETGWYDAAASEYTVSTARELAGLALLVKQGTDFAGKTVKLGRDISLSNDDNTFNRSVRWWDGIGTNANPFRGTFDGYGYTISEMTAVSTGSSAALFLKTDGAVIRNLTVRGESSAVGGAAGIVSRGSNTRAEDCASYVAVTSTAELAGGIAAQTDGNSALVRCTNYGDIIGTTGVGGIVGSVVDADSTLTDCINYAGVTGDGSSGGLGGVAGRIGGNLTRCANYGAIQGKNWYVGGVVGCANTQGASALTDCYNAGDVENDHTYANAATGGVIGYGNYYVFVNGFSYASVRAASGTVGGVVGLDSRRSTNKLENTAYLDSGCETDVGGVTEPKGAKAIDAAAFASEEYLKELNVDRCFALANGKYPEFCAPPGDPGFTPCDGGDGCPGRVFTDMPPKGNWAHDAIDWAVENKITAGTSATTFSPDDGCTRAQVVTFLWRAAGEPEPASGENPFTDVKESDYFFKPVLWAVEQGITNGTGAATFSPDAACSRAQIVTFLWRYEGSPAAAGGNPFADVPADAYYETAVLWASSTGVTTGTGTTTFSPDDTCTRAQIVAFLYRDITEQ